MQRLSTHRLPRLAAVLAAGLLLGACGGSSDASQNDVQEDVEEQLAENGYIAGPDVEPVEMTEGQAADAAQCISAGLFDPDAFTKDERNDVAKAGDGTPPDPDLAARFQALVDSCVADVLEVGPSAPSDDDEG